MDCSTLSFSDLRDRCREGNLEADAWPKLPGMVDDRTGRAREHQNFNPESFNRYFLNKYNRSLAELDGNARSCSDPEEILGLLQRQYIIIEEPDLIRPLLYLLSIRILQSERCYSCMCDILDNCNWYLIPKIKPHMARLRVFRSTLQDYMPETYKELSKLSALEDRHLNKIFVYFFSGTASPYTKLTLF